VVLEGRVGYYLYSSEATPAADSGPSQAFTLKQIKGLHSFHKAIILLTFVIFLRPIEQKAMGLLR